MAEIKNQYGPTPRWLYRFLDWMRSTPFNGVLFAFVLFLIGAGLWHWAAWQFGSLARYQVETQILTDAFLPPFLLLIWILLDSIARSSITDFAVGLGKSKQETEKIYTNFISEGTTLSLVMLVIAIVGGYLDTAMRAGAYGIKQPVLVLLMGLLPMLSIVMVLLFPFRIFRQIFLVNALYKDVEKINLFNLWPIYALSRYGYTLAMLIILNAVVSDLLTRLSGGAELGLFFTFIYPLVLSLFVFLVPLIGMNRRLHQEKVRTLQGLGDQLNGVYDDITRAVRERELEKIASLIMVSTAIEKLMNEVQKVATWPWNPGSLRNLLVTISLPLLVAILQRFVLTWLGF